MMTTVRSRRMVLERGKKKKRKRKGGSAGSAGRRGKKKAKAGKKTRGQGRGRAMRNPKSDIRFTACRTPPWPGGAG